MREMLEEMFKDVDKPSKKDMGEGEESSVAASFADQIKKHCVGSGDDLNHMMNQISSLVVTKDNEEMQDAQNEFKGDTEEGSEADDKAPKKAAIVAMLKKKNSEG